MDDQKLWHVGNARIDGSDRRGWFLGHFMPPSDVRSSEDVELKWARHDAGEERDSWHDVEHRTTVLLLIRGRFRINLEVGTFVLQDQGDYAMWGPGIGHSWVAQEESEVVTIRWPSIG